MLLFREREAWRLHLALQRIYNLGLRSMIFKLDCKSVANGIQKHTNDDSEFKFLIAKYEATSSTTNYQVLSIQEQTNISSN